MPIAHHILRPAVRPRLKTQQKKISALKSGELSINQVKPSKETNRIQRPTLVIRVDSKNSELPSTSGWAGRPRRIVVVGINHLTSYLGPQIHILREIHILRAVGGLDSDGAMMQQSVDDSMTWKARRRHCLILPGCDGSKDSPCQLANYSNASTLMHTIIHTYIEARLRSWCIGTLLPCTTGAAWIYIYNWT